MWTPIISILRTATACDLTDHERVIVVPMIQPAIDRIFVDGGYAGQTGQRMV